MDHLGVVSQVLKEQQLYTKNNKFELWLRSVVFLCHIISSEGIWVDPIKTEANKNWARPLSPINIKNFLGLAGYYRRFIDGFASYASPLTTLT